ncbi:MAG: glycerol-3-phosphate acyltransferase [Chloroflexi bacterium]|nr:glycerol-3-phosphate acyltransferase [Chloroflexota bacterium]
MDLPAAAFAYLLGSISFPWLIAWWHGIDLRKAGAGKLGGSDLVRAVGRPWGVTGGLLDFAKGAVAVLIAAALGLPVEMRVVCALAVVAGQMWPLFHDLDGGRGNATGWGAMLVLDLAASAVAVIPLAAAVAMRRLVRPRPTRVVPLASLLTFLVWPAAIWETSGPPALVVGGLLLFVLILVRRLTARIRADLATGARLPIVLLDRALFDRTALQQRGDLPI